MDNNVKGFLVSFLSKLERAKVDCLILRGYDDLPDIVHNDVDFFVSKNSHLEFFDLLTSTAEEYDAIIDTVLERQGVRKLLISAPSFILHLDYWFELTFLGLKYLDSKSLLTNKINHKTELFSIPSPAYEFQVSFLKEILHNQIVRKDKHTHLTDLYSRAHFSRNDFIYKLVNNGTVDKALKYGPSKNIIMFIRVFIGLFTFNMIQYGVINTLSSIKKFIAIKYLKRRA
ncbi:hypothetical protein E2K93_01510 [Thalassotalea sp. HSM 43]|uniref:hypothetical protein n=1 Tax=Thalassotalea sp. HSM 43 TaxID=2552945 RepID=UPI0010815D38|nr:hypothetical protein [Thalassotalea sp. HSM 43]QBY03124.1 hypothetical protein E2K93_01510 [Thalassotalea sp. HSM 43]